MVIGNFGGGVLVIGGVIIFGDGVMLGDMPGDNIGDVVGDMLGLGDALGRGDLIGLGLGIMPLEVGEDLWLNEDGLGLDGFILEDLPDLGLGILLEKNLDDPLVCNDVLDDNVLEDSSLDDLLEYLEEPLAEMSRG